MISTSANAVSTRIFLGLVAGALSMLLFHQTTLQVLYWIGVNSHPAFRLSVVAPFNAPMIVSITFWGAIFGAAVSLLVPRQLGSWLLRSVLAGLFVVAMAWFVVRPLAGHPAAFGWHPRSMALSFTANLMWGFGFTLIQPILSPRCLLSRSKAWAQHHLAT
jgi:hypothetical protein